jgi:translation elongation factor EF-Tu-like GTPase
MGARKKSGRRKYGRAASKTVESAMRRRKRGTLKAGRGRRGKVKSRKQAIAIGLNEARKKGAKVPRKRAGRKGGRRKTGGRKRSS